MKNLHAVFSLALLFSGLALTQRGPDSVPSRQGDVSTFYAEIQRDCAPWDGAAFSVSIQPVAGLKKIDVPFIHVAIWQAPNLRGSAKFAFPDLTGKIGAAYIQTRSESVTPLRGTISFRRVMPNEIVEGQFDFLDPNGKRYSGKFAATWNGKIALCG